MRKIKILYITTHLFNNSSASIRNISLINGLVENKCEVDIITVSLERYDKYLKNKLSRNTKVLKIKNNLYNGVVSTKFKIVKKLGIIKFIKECVKKYLIFPDVFYQTIKESSFIELNKNYDLIISSSDSKSSHFIAGMIIKKNKLANTKWIQIWGDPWYDDINVSKNIFIRNKIKKNEEQLIKQATKVFYISDLTAKKMRERYYNEKNKIFSLGRSYLEKIKTENSIDKKKEIIFCYTGTLEKRNINYLVEKIEAYNQNNKKKIKLKIYGVDKDTKDDLDRNYIEKYPRVSYEEVVKIYGDSDVLVYLDNIGQTTQIPGKVFDYFGTNKVILGLCENEESYNFLSQFKRIELYKNKLDDINLEQVINKIGKVDVLEEYSPRILAKKFLKQTKE